MSNSAVFGKIAGALAQLRADQVNIGCPLGFQRRIPDTDGIFNDFEFGQIVWSPNQQMVISAWVTYDPGASPASRILHLSPVLHVRWNSEGPYVFPAYRVSVVGEAIDNSPLWSTSNVLRQPPGGTSGETEFTGVPGQVTVTVAGCNLVELGAVNPNCAPSDPVIVDVDPIDVTRSVFLDVPVAPATKPSDLQSNFQEHIAQALVRGCGQKFNLGDLDSDFGSLALAKLYMAELEINTRPLPGRILPSECQADILRRDVAEALRKVHVTRDVGTDCTGHRGDYDMALNLLIPIAFRYKNFMAQDAADRLKNTLLTQKGGVDSVRLFVGCGIDPDPSLGFPTPKSENHIMATESARLLTNQLLGIDNATNGMRDWMLGRLQQFLKGDFHEYNARPYTRMTYFAIHNLAEYAEEPVKSAATDVLDYIAAKYAVSSIALRRVAPFRRHYSDLYDPYLFQAGSDVLTWWGVTNFGSNQALDELRYGRADWTATEIMGAASIGDYRVPELISELATRDGANLTGMQERHRYFQVFRHEGVEAYARSDNFLISAGGDWEDNTNIDKVVGFSTKDDTNGAAQPTSLIPLWAGTTRDELIRIDGWSDLKSRHNHCVAPGFACGLNPVVPGNLLNSRRPSRDFAAIGCSIPVDVGLETEWERLGGKPGPLGCPNSAGVTMTDGSISQYFERGAIIHSKPKDITISAYLSTGTASGYQIEWTQSLFDFYQVTWERNGIHVAQSPDVPNSTGSMGRGVFTIPIRLTRLLQDFCRGVLGGRKFRQEGNLRGLDRPDQSPISSFKFVYSSDRELDVRRHDHRVRCTHKSWIFRGCVQGAIRFKKCNGYSWVKNHDIRS